MFNPLHCVLMRNNGNGTFTNVTDGTEIATAMAKGLGVVATDINNDGLLDLWVLDRPNPNPTLMVAAAGSGRRSPCPPKWPIASTDKRAIGIGIGEQTSTTMD
ncbi:MAG: VCBS repeat-containing protein [Bryobacterales bacterium]|nr:VCBS repeat-containing protein [Bryobacterales bacterium]